MTATAISIQFGPDFKDNRARTILKHLDIHPIQQGGRLADGWLRYNIVERKGRKNRQFINISNNLRIEVSIM